MTTILRTPAAWPSLLLNADAPTTKAWDDPAAALDAAVEAGAFEGLKRSVHELGPTGTISTISAAGLRGRGGAGFPTGEKWRLAARTEASKRYVVANGYGADPSVATDRTLMETNPFAVVEGIAIAAFSIGAAEATYLAALDAALGGAAKRGRSRPAAQA